MDYSKYKRITKSESLKSDETEQIQLHFDAGMDVELVSELRKFMFESGDELRNTSSRIRLNDNLSVDRVLYLTVFDIEYDFKPFHRVGNIMKPNGNPGMSSHLILCCYKAPHEFI